MPIEQLLQLIGLQCFQLASAQGENAQLHARVAELEAALTSKPSRRKKAE